jgi:hypothetical protein
MWSFPTREKVQRSHRELFDDGVPVVFELMR